MISLLTKCVRFAGMLFDKVTCYAQALEIDPTYKEGWVSLSRVILPYEGGSPYERERVLIRGVFVTKVMCQLYAKGKVPFVGK